MNEATIQKIKDITPIPNADNIETAHVLGWTVVVHKGEFKVGDYAIFVSIDSMVPERPEFEFLRDKNFRVKTVKLRGQISQGLLLPLAETIGKSDDGTNEQFDKIWKFIEADNYLGFDVSDILGIIHYEKPIPGQSQGVIKGNFPGFLSKTDEVMIQSAPELLDKLRGKPYYITVKVDGQSATFYKTENNFGVCSRNLELENREQNKYWQMVEKYHIASILPYDVYIQGEIGGPGIQNNHLGLKENELFIFNIKYIKGNTSLPFELIQGIIENNREWGWQLVPLLENGENFNYSLEQLIEKASKVKYNNGSMAEGIVVRSQDGLISFKVLNNNYLLKERE